MKYTLITGASSGIGYELAKIFADKKQNLILVARRKEKLDHIAEEFRTHNQVEVKVIQKDLSQPKSAREVFDEVKDLEVETLINNAGFGDYGAFAKSDLNKQTQMMRLNMEALTALTHLFLPKLIESKGKLMNVASTAAFQPGPLMSVYYATKAYVLHFTEAIAEELDGTGVKVTALCPGATASEFQKTSDLEGADFFKGKIPSSREVAMYGYKALIKGKVVAVHGWKNKLFAFGHRLFPRSWVRKITRRVME